MIVPSHDTQEMSNHVYDFGSQPGFFSGGANGIGPAPRESLLNPRRCGFGNEDPFYIPVYLETEE